MSTSIPKEKRPGAFVRGVDHHDAKLTPKLVQWIRDQYAAGQISQKELAEATGVNQQMISKIVRGLAWTHV